MKHILSSVAFVLVLCTIIGMFSGLVPTASAATVKVKISDIIIGGSNLANSIENNKKITTGVNCNGTKVTCEQFLYLATKAIVLLNDGKAKSTKISVKDYGKSGTPSETLSATFTMKKSEYVQRASVIYRWMESKGCAPASAKISKGTLRYENCLYVMSQILRTVRKTGSLPSSLSVKKWSDVVGTIAAERTAAKKQFPEYLQATKNCPADNADIKALGKTAIGNAKTLRQAAKNLVEYLNDETNYQYYANSSKGALKTWEERKGNCCDLAHLVVACARAQGIPARYVHAICYFEASGKTEGHVYAELWTGEKWEVADIVNAANYLGYKNNTDVQFHNYYIELPF